MDRDTNESTISWMLLQTTMLSTESLSDAVGVGSQLAKSTLPDMGQDRQTHSSIAYCPYPSVHNSDVTEKNLVSLPCDIN